MQLHKRIARKDHNGIKKGQTYYTWHPKGSPWQYSLKKPDLRSAWEKEYSELEEKANESTDDTEMREEVRQEIQTKIDELQTNLENMPEQLQEHSILNDRINELQVLLEDLEY